MEIKYQNQRLKKFLKDGKRVAKAHSKVVYKVFSKTIAKLRNVDNFWDARKVYPGMHIEKLLGKKKNTWAFRLNKKYRVECETKDLEMEKIKVIVITRLHPHKYNK